MADICLITNPTAKSGEATNAVKKVCEHLEKRGADFAVWETEYPGHATELAKEAVREGYKLIVSVGGDGTLRETALGVAQTDAVLGVIACGTGNDFVRTMKIPTDLEKAADVLLDGEDRIIDAGMANGEMFFNAAGFGFDVDVLDYTEFYKPKCKNGSTAYLRGLARALLKLQLRKAKITFPDGTIEKNVLLVAAGNGRFYGGGIEVTPDADPSDGYLDICIVHDVNYFKVPKILPRFLKGKHLGLKEVTYRKEKMVSIECEPESRIQVDGERMPGTPVTFRIVEKALKIRVPKTE